MSLKVLLNTAVWLAYPLAIFFGMQIAEPRYVACFILASLLLRKRAQSRQLLNNLSRIDFFIISLLAALGVATAIANNELLLRLYPLGINFGMLALFGASLINPPSMIERFARLHTPALPPEAIAYTRKVTQIWCLFFIFNGLMAAGTAFFCTRATWALYNGLVSYVLMGFLFVGEWLFRRFLLTTRSE